MDKYHVNLKPPSGRAKVWAGPNSQSNVYATPEDDRTKTRRESICSQLGNLNNTAPAWSPRKYRFTLELSEEQVEKVRAWPGIRTVIKAD